MNSLLRERTILIGSAVGGVGTTTLATALAYEAVRYGLNVLLVDCQGGGGFSSVTRRYAQPEVEISLAQALQEQQPVPIYPVDQWALQEDLPWERGGPLVTGGQLYISPTYPPEVRSMSITAALSDVAGTRAQRQLARSLAAAEFIDEIDLVLIDVPGGYTKPQLNAALYAAGHVLFPMTAEIRSCEGIQKLDHNIQTWSAATGKDIHYLGVVPMMVDRRSHDDVFPDLAPWIGLEVAGVLDFFLPGIERRSAFPVSQFHGRPVTDTASTLQGRRDLGTVPVALAKTALAVLCLAGAGDNAGIARLRKKLLGVEMPAEWKTMLTSADTLTYSYVS